MLTSFNVEIELSASCFYTFFALYTTHTPHMLIFKVEYIHSQCYKHYYFFHHVPYYTDLANTYMDTNRWWRCYYLLEREKKRKKSLKKNLDDRVVRVFQNLKLSFFCLCTTTRTYLLFFFFSNLFFNYIYS